LEENIKMNVEQIRNYCIEKKGVTEGFPFDEETLVIKVMEKMFALVNLVPPFSINLKCDPEKAIELREEHEEITPGFHMNKKHWNTFSLEGRLTSTFIKEWIDHSYNCVVKGLPKKDRDRLAEL